MTEKPYEKLRCFGRAYDDTMKTAKPIDALLRKEFAIEILRGEKQNEFCAFSEFWISVPNRNQLVCRMGVIFDKINKESSDDKVEKPEETEVIG